MNKKIRNSGRPRPDRYSKKNKGYISQTLRITVEEAKRIRKAASLQRISINLWMTNHLTAIADSEIAAAKTSK